MRLHTSPLHSLKTKLMPCPYFKRAPGIALLYKYHICFNHLPYNMAAHIWKYSGSLLKGHCWNKDTTLRTNILVHRVSAESVAVMTSKAIPLLTLHHQCHTDLILASHIDPPWIGVAMCYLRTLTYQTLLRNPSCSHWPTESLLQHLEGYIDRDTKVSCVVENYVSWSKAIQNNLLDSHLHSSQKLGREEAF